MGRTIKSEICRSVEVELLLLRSGPRHVEIVDGPKKTGHYNSLNFQEDIFVFEAFANRPEIERDLLIWLKAVGINSSVLVENTIKPEMKKRPYGLAKGLFKVPDDFDDPLSDEILELFEGK
jgi:hypothetical protein